MKRIKVFVTCLIISVIFSGAVFASEKISVSFDKDKAFVGDIINMKISAELGEDEKLSANQDINFSNFDVAGYNVKRISAVPNVYEIDLKIAAYKTGLLEIEPAALNYINRDGNEKQFFTPASKFEIASVLSGGGDENIKDIKPLRKLARNTGYIVLMILAAIAAGIFAALLLKDIKRKKEEEAIAAVILTPQEKAFKNLQEIYDSYKNGNCDLRICYYKMSEILRTYVSEKYHFNALEMTTVEFFEKIKRSLPQEINVNEFKNYLKIFSLARYAGFKPSGAETENNFNYTKNLLERL